MNTKKKILFLLACIWLCISMFVAQSTYAKYVSAIQGLTDVNFAFWYIEINEQNILANNDISNIITPVFVATDYISQDVIVPGSEGYFDLDIDVSGVTMDFRYTITIELDETNAIPDIVVSGYSIDGVRTDFTDYSDTAITNEVGPEIESIPIRIFVKWNDDVDTQTTDDVGDTAVAISAGTAVLNVSISFEQIIVVEEPTP